MAKILLDARMYGLEHTGVGRYIMRLLEELGKLDKQNNYVVLLRKKYFKELKLPKNWGKVLVDFRYYTIEEQLKLPGIIKEQKPDLVHFPHLNVPIFWKGKFVATLHDMTMHRQGTASTTLPLPVYYMKRIPYKIVFRHAVKKSQIIITPTNSVKNELTDRFNVDKAKIRTIYMGLDDEFFKTEKDGSVLAKYGLKGDYFIYTGNVYPHKNIERAIVKRLEKSVKDLGAENYVKLLGFVPDEDLKTLYSKSIAFVYPSLSEGFGLQGLEATAAGTLVLASDIPVFREAYQNNAIYFNPHDFSSVAKVMKDAIEMKKEKRERIIKSGQKFIKRYSWTKMAKETLAVYKKVLLE
jgi:glycosyltransferase involved in cell wall biosynthesis